MSKRLFVCVVLLILSATSMLLNVPMTVTAQDATPTPAPTITPTLEPPPNCPVLQNESKDIRTSYYMGKGYGFMTSGLLSDAILSFTCVIRVVNPNYVAAYMMRGAAYVSQQEYDRARSEERRVGKE